MLLKPESTAIGALHSLLVESYSVPELRFWLTNGPYADVVPWLPGESVGKAEFVLKMIEVLQRHGRINREFFTYLIVDRPLRRKEVELVAALWQAKVPLAPDGHDISIGTMRRDLRIDFVQRDPVRSSILGVHPLSLEALERVQDLGRWFYPMVLLVVWFIVCCVIYGLQFWLTVLAAILVAMSLVVGWRNVCDRYSLMLLERNLRKIYADSPLLASAIRRVDGEDYFHVPTMDAVFKAVENKTIRPVDAARFLFFVVCRYPGILRWTAAQYAVPIFDRYGVGRESIDVCTRKDMVSVDERDWVASSMTRELTSDQAVLQCHRWLTSSFMVAPRYSRYYSFLTRNLASVERLCYDKMVAFLLDPDAEIDLNRLECLFLVCDKSSAPDPVMLQLGGWLKSGRIIDEDALYYYYMFLTEIIRTPYSERCMQMVVDAIGHVAYMVKPPVNVDAAMRYLVPALDEKFAALAPYFIRMFDSVKLEYYLFSHFDPRIKGVVDAMRALVVLWESPSDGRARDVFASAEKRLRASEEAAG